MTFSLPRSSILGILMLMSSLLPFLFVPTKKLSQQIDHIDLERAIPTSFGEWKIEAGMSPIIPTAETQENLNKTYDQIVSRTYVNASGKRMMLSVAYGGTQNRELRAHRQEVCYAAQGFLISRLKKSDLLVNGVTVQSTSMVAQQGSRTEPVTYWFTMGDTVVRGFLDRQLVDLKYTLSGYIPDGYLFRVSSLSTDVDKEFESQRMFADELLKHSDKQLVKRLLGSN